jgi:hypothetical protein
MGSYRIPTRRFTGVLGPHLTGHYYDICFRAWEGGNPPLSFITA